MKPARFVEPPPAGAGGADFPNVVLVGARAAGKSRASRRFAAAAGWTRVSTDELLEERLGPIPSFVERCGWERFRDEESAVLAGISGERLVVDCGGGIVERAGNLRLLRALGSVYWIRAPLRTLEERLARPKNRRRRPPLPGADPAGEAAVVLERRTPLYREAADCDIWSAPARGVPGDEAADRLRRTHFGPRLALSVAGETAGEAKAALAAAGADAGPSDLIELRADHLRTPSGEELASILGGLSEPFLARLIVTARRREEGGRFPGDERRRIAFLCEAARLGAGYVDLEFESDRESGGAISRRLREIAPRTRIIASFHDPEAIPADLETLPDRMAATEPAIVKVAVAATGWREVRRVHRLIRKRADAGEQVVGIALGAAGAPLRVIAGAAGAALSSYAPPGGRPAIAPGQLPAGEIRARGRRWGRKLDAPTPVYGVVGHPVGHSLSPAMHEAAFRRSGLDAAYLPFAVPPPELPDFLTAARLSGISGLNVTIPHKRAVIPFLDGLDPDAQRIGAVNTILPVDDGLIGANTDLIGAVGALEEATPLTGRRATVIGAGGAARAVLHGLLQRGAEVLVISRNDRKAAALADEFGAGHAPAARIERIAGDILVNATPAGMAPETEGCPVPDAAIAAHEVIFDLVFEPRRTVLLRKAETLGKRTVFGVRMLALQAAAAFERWTGLAAPVETMAAAARTAQRAR